MIIIYGGRQEPDWGKVSRAEGPFGWLNMSHCDTNTRSRHEDDEHSEVWSRSRSLDWPRARSSSTADDIRTTLVVGNAAYGADRTCQSPFLKGLVAVRYRPRAINNRPCSFVPKRPRSRHWSSSGSLVVMAPPVLLERCQHPAFVFIPYLLRNLMDSDQHCLAHFLRRRFPLLVY
jgi:hypothetical protein